MPATMNEVEIVDGQRLGRLPVKSSRKALMFSDFVRADAPDPPKKMRFWERRKPFPIRTFGNTSYGSCTRSKQAIASMRLERLEQRRTINITDEEIIRVYKEMSDRRYGGGDNGAYETDALDDWRNPETTFSDVKGRKMTIDAYTRLNPYNHREIKMALATAGAHGIAVCFNLPWAWRHVYPPRTWEIPAGTQLTGDWMPGSWGGHSMWAIGDYDELGFWVPHTWNLEDQFVTWEAAAVYMDEAHLVIDSVNYWKKNK